jgi:hypothetical protein
MLNIFQVLDMITNNYFRTKKVDGYDSKTECKRAWELKLLEKAGKIKDLKEQVSFELQPSFKTAQGKTIRKMEYTPDFVYYDFKFKGLVAEESKGFRTPDYRIRAKLFQYKYPQYIFIETGLPPKRKRKSKK